MPCCTRCIQIGAPASRCAERLPRFTRHSCFAPPRAAPQVYDVTSYIEHHPGGDAIFWHAGDDCTEGFHGIQHPPTV